MASSDTVSEKPWESPSTPGVSVSSTQTSSDAAQPSTPANASQGGREINSRVLHVSGVDSNVTEDMLSDLFKVTGNVVSIKIFPDKNRRGFNYAFVEYETSRSAELALYQLNHRVLNYNVSLK